MKVCYFGLYDPTYPRNRMIREGLKAHGVAITECRIEVGYRGEQYRALTERMRRTKDHFDALIVAEHNQFVVPLAWLWARQRGVPVIFDPFTSAYASDVVDRREVAVGSFQARKRWALDYISMNLADALLADTDQHRQYFSATFRLRQSKIHVVPVGADERLYRPRRRPGARSCFLVLFWGTYIPLHGVETIVHAAYLLRDQQDIAVELIGDGQTYEAVRSLAADMGLPATMFRPRMPEKQLPAAIAQADICLGIFGSTSKALRVVPNKVYQAVAMRQPVISGDSPALREFFTPGQHLCAVPMSDGTALADAITQLYHEPSLRNRLASAGYQRYLTAFTPQAIGRRVLAVLEQVLSR